MKKTIRFQKILFVFFVLALSGAFVWGLFSHKQYQSRVESLVYDQSKSRLQTLFVLKDIQQNYQILKKSAGQYLLTGEAYWLDLFKSSHNELIKQSNGFLKLVSFSEIQDSINLSENYYKDLQTQLMTIGPQTSAENLAVFYKSLQSALKLEADKYRFAMDEAQKFYNPQTSSTSLSYDAVSKLFQNPYETVIKDSLNKLIPLWDMSLYNRGKAQFKNYLQVNQGQFHLMLALSAFLVGLAAFLGVQNFQTIHKQRLIMAKYKSLGAFDEITGLMNRKGFETVAKAEFERAKRQGYHLSVLKLSLDSWKNILDDFGKLTADRILYQLTLKLKSMVRRYDGFFRFEDNSLILVMPQTSAKALQNIVVRIRKELFSASFVIDEQKNKIIPKFRIGTAIYPAHADSLSELLSLADDNFVSNYEVVEAVQKHYQEEDEISVTTISPFHVSELNQKSKVSLHKKKPYQKNKPSVQRVEGKSSFTQEERQGLKQKVTPKDFVMQESQKRDPQYLELETLVSAESTPQDQQPAQASVKSDSIDDSLPEIVAALELRSQRMHEKTSKETVPYEEAIKQELTKSETAPQSKPIPVEKSQVEDEVIFVDFDQEASTEDLAVRFRERQKSRYGSSS